ncbi:MAG: hypothetical protein AAGF24_08160 [Cyanobacteria bacterium P01_H01_bin.121]
MPSAEPLTRFCANPQCHLHQTLVPAQQNSIELLPLEQPGTGLAVQIIRRRWFGLRRVHPQYDVGIPHCDRCTIPQILEAAGITFYPLDPTTPSASLADLSPIGDKDPT